MIIDNFVKRLVILVLDTSENPSRHVLARPRAEVEKIDKINKSIPPPKAVVIFVLSTLENPSRHVLATP
ncbi:hypothetical protein Y032_0656g1213 [Ancylostoma ceylanicum]|uniref:Uncharacterized protein n=1 Tax=Ancylostoma ceylanicum TaxID=53326 RepID=A0A016WK78_9BILA|nr:hypothetical protein Y032_0656g1213 [Ancylostoma ceylanicum]